RAPGDELTARPGRERIEEMALSASSLKVGDTHSEEVVDDLTRTQIVQYAGASGDYNPLHSDDLFTTEVAKYPSVFAHGMLTMGMTGKMLTNYVGDERLTEYGVRFTSQVFPGATLTATAEVAAIREEDGQHLVDLTVTTVDQEGTTVLSGTATARIDP
ncbi:MAG TPA: MaoC/PaaZ C-terminal domain-containing protein, partial [Acidimicrobiia bacterium]|nr:MaoC/PaaZ C-terminal domain-containing protein [Acidimicrobiia bacterium]